MWGSESVSLLHNLRLRLSLKRHQENGYTNSDSDKPGKSMRIFTMFNWNTYEEKECLRNSGLFTEGDTLVVWKLDRLGRSMRHLIVLVEELRQRAVNFRSLTDSIDTSTPMGRFFFHIMGALAEMERELIVERTRAGGSSKGAGWKVNRSW